MVIFLPYNDIMKVNTWWYMITLCTVTYNIASSNNRYTCRSNDPNKITTAVIVHIELTTEKTNPPLLFWYPAQISFPTASALLLTQSSSIHTGIYPPSLIRLRPVSFFFVFCLPCAADANSARLPVSLTKVNHRREKKVTKTHRNLACSICSCSAFECSPDTCRIAAAL